MTATHTPVEHARLVQGGTAWYPRGEHSTFEEAEDCWNVIGWLLLIAVAVVAVVLGFAAFGAGYLLHRWVLL